MTPLTFMEFVMSVPVEYGPLVEIQMQQNEIDEVVGQIESMPDNGLMVEWGSGGSTIKWLESMKADQRLITIEHNIQWYNKVNDYLKTRDDIKNRASYIYRPELFNFRHGYARVEEELAHGLDDYFIPDTAKGLLDADIFFVDGIGRATTALLMKFMSTKPDPVIYIHDYYGREEWYSWATQFFSKKEKVGHTLVRLWK